MSAIFSVAVDQFNDAYVTGYLTLSNGGSAISTVKYDPNGNQLWVQRYSSPGPANAAGNAIAVDNSGNVYVAGYVTETNGFTLRDPPSNIRPLRSKSSRMATLSFTPTVPLARTLTSKPAPICKPGVTLGNAVADTNGVVQFADTNAPSFNQRFYYAVPQ